MREKPILVIMAAGMGSRYGGLKQIDPVGPSGEAIIDYSLYDARRAGFETVVLSSSTRSRSRSRPPWVPALCRPGLRCAMPTSSWTAYQKALPCPMAA